MRYDTQYRTPWDLADAAQLKKPKYGKSRRGIPSKVRDLISMAADRGVCVIEENGGETPIEVENFSSLLKKPDGNDRHIINYTIWFVRKSYAFNKRRVNKPVTIFRKHYEALKAIRDGNKWKFCAMFPPDVKNNARRASANMRLNVVRQDVRRNEERFVTGAADRMGRAAKI